MKKVQKVLLQSVINKIKQQFLSQKFKFKFPASEVYWENRYIRNGTSGNGSYGILAIYKAGILNKFVADNKITKVIDFGCGDGNQLQQFEFPLYIGLDVSITAIEKCINIFRYDLSKNFFVYNRRGFADNLHLFKADLVISLDVIYHLVEEEVYENYMHQLFSFSSKFIIIYAWDTEGETKLHVKHRKFSQWIIANKKDWRLRQKVENVTFQACDFFIYEKNNNECKNH